ncbi:hypothetical protein F2Q68_00009330 [Brassica cretica]|nr:hypothetical protein F2Q68_00009330 [Brassica cretica]
MHHIKQTEKYNIAEYRKDTSNERTEIEGANHQVAASALSPNPDQEQIQRSLPFLHHLLSHTSQHQKKQPLLLLSLSTTVNVNSNPQEVENATWMLTVFNFFGRQFCLHFEAFQLGTAPVYMAFLRFMGDENETKKFSYGLEVGAHSRKLTWQGIPRSIRDGHRKVRDSHDGLIIPRNMALFFSGSDKEERKLRVTGRIWREE